MDSTYADLYYRYKEMVAAGQNAGNSKKAAKILTEMQNMPEHQIVKSLSSSLIEMEKQIQELTPYLSLTDEEIQSFYDKAIADIEPWYQEKVQQIQTGVQEGQVRTAEDTLLFMREVEQEAASLMAKYDLSSAQTQEEFVDKLAALTSTTEDTLEKKKLEWGQRIENVKLQQIQKGILSSGIGAQKRDVEEKLKANEIGSIERRALEEQTDLERDKTYNLEQIRLARQSAEQDRIRRIGTPEQANQLSTSARDTLGLEAGQDIGSEAEIAAKRTERGISPIYTGGDTLLRDLEEEKGKRILSRSGEYEEDELANREATYGAQIDKILAEQAKKKSQLSSYGMGY